MKKTLGLILTLLATIAWIWVTNSHFSGLNSLQSLASYRSGLIALQPLDRKGSMVIKTTSFQSEIRLDSLGIPNIFGADDNSLAYSLGYMHARDRYFQMELITHMVMGRLSEIIGEAGIRSDKVWKSFQAEETALRVMDSLRKTDPALVSYLHAYAQGINDYIRGEDALHRDPLYVCWNYQPEPWKDYYPLLVQWYMSYDLSYFNDILNKQELLDKLPDSIRRMVYPESPDHQPLIIPSGGYAEKDRPQQQAIVNVFTAGMVNHYSYRENNRRLGSNNWVVGPARTKSGQLLLCNDLHLFLSSPNIFYEAQLCSPDLHVYGFTIPGVPVVVTGHNNKIAWGITNGGWDVSEQYLVKLNPANKNQYLLAGKWQPLQIRHFTILVKGGRPVNMDIPYTVFGPLERKGTFSVATRWHPAIWNAAVRSFWKLARSKDWASFRESLRCYDYPAQNFVYADSGGNIGILCAGKMPEKPLHYGGGLLDGTRLPDTCYIPFDSLPSALNPARGYLFSANQEPERGKYYYSSRWFDDLYRPARINELLADRDTVISSDYVRRMQGDITDISIRDWQKLLAAYGNSADLSANWRSIAAWDGRLVPGKKEATFYKAIRRAVRLNTQEIASALGVRAMPGYDQFMDLLSKDCSFSFKGRTLSSRQYFNRVLRQADSIYNRIYLHGGVPDQELAEHAYSFSIPQMTFLPVFDLRVDHIGGSENTINVNYPGAHPVVRTLIEIGKSGIRSWMVNATGQTGRLNAPDYVQQLQDWKRNELHETQFVRDPSGLHSISQTIFFTKEH